ncbi:MAG: hypothetical protein JWN79_319 [Gemmatimonadetes bacterium]|jgi:hypothetical protein|nr:hypothetical protein [Gemmatimonadota bacterium]
MQRLRIGFIAGAALVVASAGAGAQVRGSANIPAGFMPPAGMCRVWYDGVAPGRQPAPTTCQNARASLRANTRLVYGPALRTTDPRNGTYDPRNGTYDPRNDGRDQGGWNNGRTDGRNDGRYDRLSDKQRRELDKQRRKSERERQNEWKKAQRNGHGDGDDDDNDDGDRNDHDGNRSGDRRDRGRYDRNGSRAQGTIYDGRTGRTTNQPGTWGRASGTAGAQCIDANRDGVCDNQQGVGRVRIP